MGEILYLPRRLPPPWAARHVELAHPDRCPACEARRRFRWVRRIAFALLLVVAALISSL